MNNFCNKELSKLPLVDINQLESLSDLSDESGNLVEELFTLFRSTTPEIIEELCAAVSGGNHNSARRLAHRLKGSAANIGAVRLAAYCAELEQYAKNEDLILPPSCHVAVRNHWNECLSAIENWLKNN